LEEVIKVKEENTVLMQYTGQLKEGNPDVFNLPLESQIGITKDGFVVTQESWTKKNLLIEQLEIGRGSPSSSKSPNIILDGKSVSRNHCKIFAFPNEESLDFYYQDIASFSTYYLMDRIPVSLGPLLVISLSFFGQIVITSVSPLPKPSKGAIFFEFSKDNPSFKKFAKKLKEKAFGFKIPEAEAKIEENKEIPNISFDVEYLEDGRKKKMNYSFNPNHCPITIGGGSQNEETIKIPSDSIEKNQLVINFDNTLGWIAKVRPGENGRKKKNSFVSFKNAKQLDSSQISYPQKLSNNMSILIGNHIFQVSLKKREDLNKIFQ